MNIIYSAMFVIASALVTCNVTRAAEGTTLSSRWHSYYEENDTVPTPNGIQTTTQVANTKAGAYTKTGLLKWDLYHKSLTFSLKVSDWNAVKVLSLVAGNDAKFAQSATIDLKTRIVNPTSNDWMHISIPFSAWVVDTTIDWKTVDNLLLVIEDNGISRVSVELTDLRVHNQPKQGAISFTIDDGLSDTMKLASVLKEFSYTGTAFLDVSKIGQPGYITESDVSALLADGWQIGGHKIGKLTNLLPNDMTEHVEYTRAYLQHRGIKTFEYALPNGARSDPIIKQLANAFEYIHNIDGMSNGATSIVASNINRHSIDRHTSLQQVKDWIMAANDGEWVILNFHSFSDDWKLEEDWAIGDVRHVLEFVQTMNIPVVNTNTAIQQFRPSTAWWKF